MPSSDDMFKVDNEARELAIDQIVKQEKCSRQFAAKYVAKLSKEEIADLIGWPKPGAPYSAW